MGRVVRRVGVAQHLCQPFSPGRPVRIIGQAYLGGFGGQIVQGDRLVLAPACLDGQDARVADGRNDAIIGPSVSLGADLRSAFASGTGEPFSSYDGTDGIQPRDDLAGINLSTVPKVFIECANMRNATDAALVTSLRWQATAARAIAAGLTAYLTRTG